MALGNQPEPPPELAAKFSRLLGYRQNKGTPDKQIFLLPSARSAQKRKPPGFRIAEAERAAEWLTNEHAAGMSTTARRSFATARKNEILSFEWPNQYWAQMNNVRDETEICYPSCSDYSEPIPPEYDDPERRPGFCTYNLVSSRWNTPEGAGTPEQPAPGWSGQLNDGRFDDQWMTQRYIRFTGSIQIHPSEPRPLMMEVDTEIHCNAELRGNRVWFTPVTWAVPSNATWHFNNALYIRSMTNVYRYKLPGTSPTGWTHSIKERVAFDLKQIMRVPYWQWSTGIHLKHSYKPAMGMFFSGNEWAEAYWSGSIKLYYAKTA